LRRLVDLDGATVHLGHRADDRQAEAEATLVPGAGVVEPREPLEDLGARRSRFELVISRASAVIAWTGRSARPRSVQVSAANAIVNEGTMTRRAPRTASTDSPTSSKLAAPTSSDR
jgi:hypothetical protein